MNAYYKGQLLCGPRGPAGPDGSPVGTVISFLGLTAPSDYLICDGTTYSISDYPELAEFLQQHFGAANHFGGDGTSTFAVPDMRNLFLRGYHGEAEEQLSGDVGEKQEATKIPNIYVAAYGRGFFAGKNPSLDGNWPDQVDMKEPEQSTYSETSATVHSGAVSAHYTARPVNMAVLFCIKAAETLPAENTYSLKETRIGTWLDGKPLYRQCVEIRTANTVHTQSYIFDAASLQIDNLVNFYGAILLDSFITPLTFYNSGNYYSSVFYDKGKKQFMSHVGDTAYANRPAHMVLEYTKTTDRPAVSISAPTEQSGNFALDMPSMPVTTNVDKLKEED